MWYNATASALTPPLQSIPRRCQRRGDRLLPEPNLSDAGLHYRQDSDCSASATAPCRRLNTTPILSPVVTCCSGSLCFTAKKASLRITTLWRCRIDGLIRASCQHAQRHCWFPSAGFVENIPLKIEFGNTFLRHDR
jgi:hypothetical protein